MRRLMLLLGGNPPTAGSRAYDTWILETGRTVEQKFPTLISRLKENLRLERLCNSFFFNQPFATIEVYRHDVEEIIDFLEWREKTHSNKGE